jgi:hypothetical protein
MRFSNIFFTVLAAVVAAAPSPEPDSGTIKAAQNLNAQQQLVFLTLLELARLHQKDDSIAPILQPTENLQDVTRFIEKLPDSMPFDVNGVARFVTDNTESQTNGQLGGLMNVLNGMTR